MHITENIDSKRFERGTKYSAEGYAYHNVTKQFIRKHAHKDPYPGAPYKVLPDLVVKYNLVTEVWNCHGDSTHVTTYYYTAI